ncbi:MAG TPA: FG-GAP and VCBS repeat-containing protein [Verrucomicrobiae bacterium]
MKAGSLIIGFLAPVVFCQSSLAEPAVPSFKAVTIDSKIGIGYGITVADVDGDKKLDIILVDKDQVVWYQNPTWKKHVIAEKLTPKDHVCIAAADIDGDGKAEIAVGAEWNPNDTENSGAVFYLIPPADRTQKWGPVKLSHEPTVHRMRWVKNAEGKFDLVVVPLHGRGNKGGAGLGVKVFAYKMPANPKDPWKMELLNNSLHMTHNFQPVQWNHQTGQEILIGGKEGVLHLAPPASGWVSYDPAAGKPAWQATRIIGNAGGETNTPGVGEVRVGTLGNGTTFIATVEPMHGNQLAFYTSNSRTGNTPGAVLWRRHLLDDTLVDGHALACGDFAGTGSDQIVVGWRAMGKADAKVGIKMFTPLDPEGKNWKQTLIDDNGMACEDLCVADLDGDGKLDIIAAGRATKNVKIYFNMGTK